jgi:hypothetical protein
MNNDSSIFNMYSFPYPLLLQAKEGGAKWVSPLCKAERVWGEFVGLYD